MLIHKTKTILIILILNIFSYADQRPDFDRTFDLIEIRKSDKVIELNNDSRNNNLKKPDYSDSEVENILKNISESYRKKHNKLNYTN